MLKRLSELLPRPAVLLELKTTEKTEVIRELARPLVELGFIIDETEFVAAILKRENLESTGIGMGVAIPHARTNTVRATAVVTHDETRYARVAPRFSGWVRKLHVNFTGAPVEKGQPLFTVYSPELFSTENEYLIAWRGLQQLRPDAPADQRLSATNLLTSARRRLELWEVGEEEIRALEQRGVAGDELLFRAPFSGHVVAKTAIEGKAFLAGESLYEVADLAHLWIEAWLSESDLPLMKPGLQAAITFPSLGHKTVTAPITFLYPHLDPQTRRGRVRLELDNPDHLLRPDMWASVEVQIPLGAKLLVPASAVIDTGQRFIAFVEGEDAHLQPRELKVGFKTDDYYEVLDGVQEGERVVTRALFLVDSESQLKAAIAGMGGGRGARALKRRRGETGRPRRGETGTRRTGDAENRRTQQTGRGVADRMRATPITETQTP